MKHGLQCGLRFDSLYLLDGFADLFGWEGVKTYLDLAQHGLQLQLELANQILPDPEQQVKKSGSLMVCDEKNL